jgi:hypothetical protein
MESVELCKRLFGTHNRRLAALFPCEVNLAKLFLEPTANLSTTTDQVKEPGGMDHGRRVVLNFSK